MKQKLFLILTAFWVFVACTNLETVNQTATAPSPPNDTQLTATPEPILPPVVVGDESGAFSYLSGSFFTGFQLNFLDSLSGNVRTLNKEFGKIWDYSWSPNGRYIGFLANTTRMQEKTLYLLDVANGEIKSLTSNTKNVVDFAWSPDSEVLVFSDITGTNETIASIWTIEISGSNLKKLGIDLDSNIINSLSWSPDGKRLSFISNIYSDNQIQDLLYIVDSDGRNLIDINTSGQLILWSPIENKVFIGDYFSLKALDLTTNEISELIDSQKNKPRIMDSFALSPDGKNIAYRSHAIQLSKQINIEFPTSNLHVFNIAAITDQQLTDVEESYASIAWSPDGNKIAFSKCNKDQCSINTSNINKMEINEVVQLPIVELSRLEWIPPVELNPTIIPPTPVPVEPWTLLPEPPLYDDFESEIINYSKWDNVWGASASGSSGQYSYKQENGILEINSNEDTQSVDFGLPFKGARTITQMQAFEAKIKISNESEGFAFAKIQIRADLHTYDWFTQCRVGNSLQNNPTFVCDVAKTFGGYGIVYQTEEISIDFNQWYTVRIEIQPNSGAVQYYLDGNLLSTYIPDDVDELTQKNIQFYPNLGAWISSGSITAFFDDVRISEKK